MGVYCEILQLSYMLETFRNKILGEFMTRIILISVFIKKGG